MLICDLHCDLPDKMIDGAKLVSNNCHWAEENLKKEHTYVQVFASYVDKYKFDDPFDRVNSMILNFKKQLEQSDIKLVTDYKGLEKNINDGKNSAILAIEGGEALGGKIERVKYFFDLGVRFMTLTWNHQNQLGQSCFCTDDVPLTDFGKRVIKEMNRLGMTPDVSHLSEKGFWSVVETSEKPIVATHSNSKKLCTFKRNLTDQQFLAIKESGGLAGVCFVPDFLEDDGKTADIKSIIKHIEHFMSLGGENTVCLGGDLDGVYVLPKGLKGIQDVHKIANELAKINYQEEIIAKIVGKNIKNYIKSMFL